MGTSVGSYEAEAHLHGLLERVVGGERITITKHGVPVAVLVPAVPAGQIDVRAAVEAMKASRKGRSLGGLSIREMVEEGRNSHDGKKPQRPFGWPQFTMRSLLMLVLAFALYFAGAEALRRRQKRFTELSLYHEALARRYTLEAVAAGPPPAGGVPETPSRSRLLKQADHQVYYINLYRNAATKPWIFVIPDSPPLEDSGMAVK